MLTKKHLQVNAVEHEETPHNVSVEFVDHAGSTGDEGIRAAIGRISRQIASEPRIREELYSFVLFSPLRLNFSPY